MKDDVEVITNGEISGIGVFVLTKAIDIDGEKVKEIKYDFDAMTAWDKQQASKEFKKAGNIMSVEEFDSDYHLFMFASAVKKANDNINTEDILRMSAKDSCRAESLVRDFFFLGSEDLSATNI
jgi:hypothetical protein